jgi:hypothetical protein
MFSYYFFQLIGNTKTYEKSLTLFSQYYLQIYLTRHLKKRTIS